jgi:hypothetical protein
VRAIRVGADTTAGQIAHLVESAPIGDTRMQNHAELLADRLVVPTLALAAVTADFGRFLSLVIVDYGTGIRVVAPTSVLASKTHEARAGIVIKSGGHMERLPAFMAPRSLFCMPVPLMTNLTAPKASCSKAAMLPLRECRADTAILVTFSRACAYFWGSRRNGACTVDSRDNG